MKYYSLGHLSPEVDFKTATRQGQAPDKGLYFPRSLPTMSPHFVDALPAHSLVDMATTVLAPFTEGNLSVPVLRSLLAQTLTFDIPLVTLSPDLCVLELFHGPTLAFKDVGARFMSRCMGYFERGSPSSPSEPITVLVATSGDTGGAVANGFDGVAGVRVVILYPKGKVSPVQEWQLTTCGDNVTAFEVEGTFDDCQRLVKEAFGDVGLQAHLRLTSANSINVARWLPQQVYYWWAYRQWTHPDAPVFVVPSGNFGNICAGLLAYHLGMPARHFLAACNANDTIPRYMTTGQLSPHPAVATLSNAMDVAVPSNFGRILELFKGSGQGLGSKVTSLSVDDPQTIRAMQDLYQDFGYVADPHTAVGYAAWKTYQSRNPGTKGILLATAHPVKFAPVIEAALGITLPLPPELQLLSGKPSRKISIGTNFDELKGLLICMT